MSFPQVVELEEGGELLVYFGIETFKQFNSINNAFPPNLRSGLAWNTNDKTVFVFPRYRGCRGV